MERQKEELEEKVARFRKAARAIGEFIDQEKKARLAMDQSTFNVEEKVLDKMLVAGVRMKGKYSECGKGFARIGRSYGRHICGKPMLLHFDTEYKENDADFEACMPVRPAKGAPDGIVLRDLPGGRCVALLHKGPYDQLGKSYARVLAYAKDRGYRVRSPTREVYLKGP